MCGKCKNEGNFFLPKIGKRKPKRQLSDDQWFTENVLSESVTFEGIHACSRYSTPLRAVSRSVTFLVPFSSLIESIPYARRFYEDGYNIQIIELSSK